MTLTDAQRELLEDKFVLWDRASREGPIDLRDYNRRAAEALKTALAICSEASSVLAGEAPPPAESGLSGPTGSEAYTAEGNAPRDTASPCFAQENQHV